jgi:hypothetical protein
VKDPCQRTTAAFSSLVSTEEADTRAACGVAAAPRQLPDSLS